MKWTRILCAVYVALYAVALKEPSCFTNTLLVAEYRDKLGAIFLG